jgi:hypothetical protein
LSERHEGYLHPVALAYCFSNAFLAATVWAAFSETFLSVLPVKRVIVEQSLANARFVGQQILASVQLLAPEDAKQVASSRGFPRQSTAPFEAQSAMIYLACCCCVA